MPKKLLNKYQKAEALISLIIAIVLFAILGNALFTLVTSSYRLITYTTARITARHLAQEKIELIRNLPYNNVGTLGGVPSGPLLQTENITRNKLNYLVKVSIIYIDDQFDDVAPNDLLPTDYKRVRVDVSWEGLASSSKNPVTLISDIAPKGIESTAGGGTLSIVVYDENAQPVPQADVQIVATATNPQIDLDLQTSDNGRVVLPGVPVCNECYSITVTKAGFSEDRTYSTSEVANPNKPPSSIVDGGLTEIYFSIDKLGNLEIYTLSDRASGFIPLGDITLDIQGENTIGTDSLDQPVYKYQEQLTSDEQGKMTIDNLETDDYHIYTPSGSTLDISGSNPMLPFLVLPNESLSAKVVLATNSQNSLLATFTGLGNTQVASVAALLFNDSGYEATQSSGLVDDPDWGQVFFSNLNAQTYHLSATISGYLDSYVDISVFGDTAEVIPLTSN